jgi:NADPH:quinone reductase-like Zn-dependent oxidoreductase
MFRWIRLNIRQLIEQSPVGGVINGRTVLVQGAAGSVGLLCGWLSRRAGSRVVRTVRTSSDDAVAQKVGAC